MTTARRLLVVALVVLGPVALLGYGLRANPRAVGASRLVGHQAPDFRLPGIDRGAVTLGELRGQAVVINFWASWCVPCREEAPALEAVWRRYREASVTVVGVNVQDRPAAARAFIGEAAPTYPNVVDTSGAVSIAYGIYGVPETFVLDRRGIVRTRHVGAVTADALARDVAAALEDSR